jgi:hypothetical protein
MPPFDLAAELAQALQDPRVASALAAHVRPVVREALADQAADTWLSAKQAAAYLYGVADATERFRKLRERHPALDRFSVGTGRLRRWRRQDLDTFLASNPRAQRRRCVDDEP